MKALTLTQPWATLVAIAAKTIETRSWSTSYRGPLAIHAAKSVPSWACEQEPFRRVLTDAGVHPTQLPRGCVVATARLVDVRLIEQRSPSPVRSRGVPAVSTDEYAFGDYKPGRFMWFLEDIVALVEPAPARGALGLWEWTP